MTSTLRITTALCALVFVAGNAAAQTTVSDPWVRAVVAQQKVTGLFASITSTKGGMLVGASSPLAGMAEVHEMRMDGDVMKMRELGAGLALPAGKAVELKPGGFHIMLMDLKQPLKVGDIVPVTLVIEGADKQRENVEVKAVVRAQGAAAEVHKH